jgi:single-stranded-DNA-specific exonuclease
VSSALASSIPPGAPADAAAPRDERPRRGPAAAPRLELPAYDLGAARALERELGASHVLAQVLVRRGLGDPAAARAFLAAGECHEPECFDGIGWVLETIRRHLDAGSRIVVHGDYDVDGVCATAVMVRALRALGADAGWFLPHRLRDGYGLSEPTIERLAQRGTGLLITVDCGITAVEQIDRATELGLDVIVTDHHAPRADGRRPACAVVHPEVCGYPSPWLCGTAVAHKLACALGAGTAEPDLELVALATVADLVPLVGENRRLVREGLRALANTARPGLRALLRASHTDPGALDAAAIGFRLAPRLNAAGRISTPEAALELLLCEEEARAQEIAAELERLNAERRAIEQRIAWEAEEQVRTAGERSAYVLAGAGWHPGVIGIVASRVTERYHRPAVLIALDPHDATAPAQGSARSIPGFDLLDGLRACQELMLRYGGHRAAAGLTIDPGRIEALRARFERHADAALTDELLAPVERADAVAGGPELGLELADELAMLEPHGIGNPRPRLLLAGARFSDVRPMGDGSHARFTVTSGGVRARAVAFGCGGRPCEQAGVPLDATFRLERNVWNGAVEPRLRLGHARPCRPAPIRVLGEPPEYLPAALAELDHPLQDERAAASEGRRELLDRRGQGPLAVLADACAAGDTLAVCAEVPRRLPGLAERTGGFALIGAHALERTPLLVAGYEQVVVLDPPPGPLLRQLGCCGAGFTHLAWGAPELRFSLDMHELEYSLRASLIALYRELRSRRDAAGDELERLLRGPGEPGRPARLAGRLLRVLGELGLVRVDRERQAALLASTAPTALERSPAYRYYLRRYEEGRRWLSSAIAPARA